MTNYKSSIPLILTIIPNNFPYRICSIYIDYIGLHNIFVSANV